MRKIGYVYKYSPTEKRGILVCGNWTDSRTTSDDMAILFSDEDLLSEVREGQLVYFDIEDGKKVKKIERASLAKFISDLINDLISCKTWGDESSFYDRNTIISFENLEDDLNSRKKRRHFGYVRGKFAGIYSSRFHLVQNSREEPKVSLSDMECSECEYPQTNLKRKRKRIRNF